MSDKLSFDGIPSGSLQLAVNVSLTQMLAPAFFDWLSRTLLAELTERQRNSTLGTVSVPQFDNDTVLWAHDVCVLYGDRLAEHAANPLVETPLRDKLVLECRAAANLFRQLRDILLVRVGGAGRVA